MKKIIQKGKKYCKQITFLMNLITPVLMLLAMNNEKFIVSSLIFFVMAAGRLLFILA